MRIIFFLLLTCYNIFAENRAGAIDTVFWFYPGSGQNIGQDSSYFPENIFSLPDTNASENFPSSSPKHICSIGLAGEICVGFKNYYIIDMEGPDFTIFENAFINPVTKKVFAEPATVSVSEDGVVFYEFPWDYKTLEGCAGTKPTNGKANPFDPKVSGGNSFDLAEIGIKKARFVKIKDICDTILHNTEHPFYDPLLSGFDLDCVVGLNLIPIDINFCDDSTFMLEVVSHKNFLTIKSQTPFNLEILDLFFRKVFSKTSRNLIYVEEFANFSDGIYFLILQTEKGKKVYKLIKVEDAIYTE
ncbi:MAG: T9SS type A sorting domain-containing protein [Ignavibacteria bacterium]|nr:T9SS type A sorting domain-containing protein [Ignavibacteria bacterium]